MSSVEDRVKRGRELAESMDWSTMPDKLADFYDLGEYWAYNVYLIERVGTCEHDCKHPGVLMGRNKVRVCPATGDPCPLWTKESDT